jgi:hypothetical protein
MPNVDNNLCRVVCLSMFSGVTAVNIRIKRDRMRDRSPTKRMSHALNPSWIPNDKRMEPTIAIDVNTDIVDRMTSLINSTEYCSRCFTW